MASSEELRRARDEAFKKAQETGSRADNRRAISLDKRYHRSIHRPRCRCWCCNG